MSENDNATLGIEAEVMEVLGAPDEWLVEAVNYGSEGEVYRTIFSGQDAKERAFAYATSAYQWSGVVMSPPGSMAPRPRPKLRLVPAQT